MTNRESRPDCMPPDGFTLIEVLTAIVVVAMITIACVTMFQQATDSTAMGMRRVEANILGRSLATLIATELQDAVYLDSTNGVDFEFVADTNGIESIVELSFVRLRNDWDDANTNLRAAVEITYSLLPDHTVQRHSRSLNEEVGYGPSWNAPVGGTLGTNIYGLYFFPDPAWDFDSGLPLFVDIYVDLLSSEQVDIYHASFPGTTLAPGDGWVYSNAMTYHSRAYLRNRYRYR